MAKGINATIWQAALSTAGRMIQEPASDHWRVGKAARDVIEAERWDGTKWVTRRLVWNGAQYVPEVVA